MRILVAGGAGFIGSNLCDHLLAKGHFVICLDNFITGSMKNIEYQMENSNFRLVDHDITTPINIAGKIDWILNFASPASPKDYEKLPIETLKVGAIGTLNLLEIAKAKKASFLLASTSEVYGDPLVSPQKETYWGNVNSIGPRSCYDEAKRFAEALTMAYHKKHGLDVRIARIFNTYGPRMRKADGRVIPNFINQALSGRPLTIYGRGKQTRSFCYIDDLLDGIDKFMAYKEEPRVFNIGNPKEFTIAALAGVMARIYGRRIKLKYEPLPQDDPKVRKPDIKLARRRLGWRPKVDLQAGLKLTLAWYQSGAGSDG